MLTGAQLALLRSEPTSNRLGKAISLARVTQLTIAKALDRRQVRQRRNTPTAQDHHPQEREEVRAVLRVHDRRPVPDQRRRSRPAARRPIDAAPAGRNSPSTDVEQRTAWHGWKCKPPVLPS